MGGYAFYVWASYGIALLVLIANVVLPRKREQEFFRVLQSRRKIPGKNQ